MFEVTDEDDVQFMLGEYKRLYGELLRKEPFIPNRGQAVTILKDLCCRHSQAATLSMLEAYLSGPGDRQHGYNLILFQKAVPALKEKMFPEVKPPVTMALKSWCPNCGTDFTLTTSRAELCGLVLCAKCAR